MSIKQSPCPPSKQSIFLRFSLILVILIASLNITTPAYAVSYALGDTPLATFPQTDGTVYSFCADGSGGFYIGGDFTSVTPAGEDPVDRFGVAHIKPDGSLDMDWHPAVTGGPVRALIFNPSYNALYVGGDFDTVNATARNYLARIKTDDSGTLDDTWNPDPDGYVRTMFLKSYYVYVGGDFTNIGGQSRNYLAAIAWNGGGSVNEGQATSWNPNPDGNVYAMTMDLMSSMNDIMYVGGNFTTIDSQPRTNLAALDFSSGSVKSGWSPDPDGTVYALASAGTSLFVGGAFTTIGGQSRNHIALIDTSNDFLTSPFNFYDTGTAMSWNPGADGPVKALQMDASDLYVGGGFTHIGGLDRNHLALLGSDFTGNTGIPTSWNPNLNDYVYSIYKFGSKVYVGGDFDTSDGMGLAAFGPVPTTMGSSEPADGGTLASGSSKISVQFSDAVVSGGGQYAADNDANFLLIGRGPNGIFDTTSTSNTAICTSPHVPVGDDVNIPIDSIVYTSGNKTSTLNFSSPLADGQYRLFVCGAASIHNLAGDPINGGANIMLSFSVAAAGSGSSASGSGASGSKDPKTLPFTGFAPNRVTALPEQPAGLAYTKMSGLWLEIPSQKVQAEIVGVPQVNSNWDVSWLGKDAGWLNGTAFPTWEGNSVLTAHVTDANGLPGPFANLKNLAYGNKIVVHLYGEKYTFEVRQSRMVFPDTTAYAFEHLKDHSYLTLITCQGYNFLTDSYMFRRVVRAVLVSVTAE